MKKRLPVLIVDDNILDLRGMAKVIQNYNSKYEVIAIDNSKTAYKIYKYYNYPVVITDIAMPNLDGLGLLEKIILINPHTKVIIITGESSESRAIKALKLKAFDYLKKPVGYKQLLESIDRAYEEVKTNYQIFNKLKEALSNGKVKLVLNELLKIETLEEDQKNEIFIQLANLNNLEKNKRMGIESDYSICINKINFSTLQIIDSIKSNFYLGLF